MKAKEKRCMNPDCRSRDSSGHRPPARASGLCVACYKAFQRLRQAGKITNEKAVKLGIITKRKKAGAARFPQIAGD